MKQSFASLVLVLVSLVLSHRASAHDPNLARWDINAQGTNLTVQLRTAGAGIHAALVENDPGADWDSMERETYDSRLEAYLLAVLHIEEEGQPLRYVDAHFVYGHEASAVLSYVRPSDGEFRELRFDISAYSDRPNQHHLLFVHTSEGSERIMLDPDSGHALTWHREPNGASNDTNSANQASAGASGSTLADMEHRDEHRPLPPPTEGEHTSTQHIHGGGGHHGHSHAGSPDHGHPHVHSRVEAPPRHGAGDDCHGAAGHAHPEPRDHSHHDVHPFFDTPSDQSEPSERPSPFIPLTLIVGMGLITLGLIGVFGRQ